MTEERHFSYRKVIFISLIVLIVIFIVLSIRLAFYQYKHSNEAFASKDIEKVKALERVILNHFPLSPYTKRAINELLTMCEKFNENDEKLYCYETLRSSLIQIKSFYQPYSEVIERIKPKIADLRAREKIAWKYNNLNVSDYDRLYNEQMAILNYDNSPSLPWSALTIFSLLGWIGSVIFMILKGITKPVNKRFLRIGIAMYIVFFSLWILGLWKA
ncbi:MAG: hypothetical protein N3F66_14960 [Spirochaetes bacterium]|nr:hypothetical protein [Spirochaetota bacterium]